MASCRLPNSPTHSTRDPGGSLTCAVDLLLRFPDRAAEVALAHRELDRQIALLLLAIDIGGARHQLDRGDLAQRNLRDGAVRPRRADPQVLDRLGALAIFRRQADDDRKMPVAAGLVEIAGGIAADRDLDGGVDVARRQPVARGLGAIDVDLDGGLAERGEHREIGDALHGREHRLDLVGGVGQRLQIVAVELDRVLALHAGDRLGDVVLQILREVELDAGKLVLQLLPAIRAVSSSLSWVPGHSPTGLSGAKNSALNRPAASVPSSGRPCCDTTDSTSGRLRISLRISLT